MAINRPINYFEKAHSCRQRAGMLRAIAETVKSRIAAEHLREKAKEWDRLAAEAEKIAREHPEEPHRKLD